MVDWNGKSFLGCLHHSTAYLLYMARVDVVEYGHLLWSKKNQVAFSMQRSCISANSSSSEQFFNLGSSGYMSNSISQLANDVEIKAKYIKISQSKNISIYLHMATIHTYILLIRTTCWTIL